MERHDPCCPLETEELDLCTCGASFRAMLEAGRRAAEDSGDTPRAPAAVARHRDAHPSALNCHNVDAARQAIVPIKRR